MIKLLNETRRNNRIYVRLLTGTPGAVVNGEALTSLPPSVLSVLEGDRNGGSFTPIRSATLGEWELPMDSAIIGSRAADDRRRPDRPLMAADASLFTTFMRMRNRRGCPAVAAGVAAAVGSRPLAAAAPTFWTVSTQADFLKGDVEDLSIDSDGRVFLGPSTALVAETSAPFLWTLARRRRRHAVGRQRQRGQGAADRQGRQAHDLLRRRRARSARARAGARTAASTSRRRPTARSTRSPPTARRRRSSIRTTSTSGRSRSTATGNALRRDRRQGRHLPDHARRQGRRSSTRPTPPTS